ncbi:MAG: transcription antitermination factor NusB [Bacteroidetes bacterium]|nr:transcription antitermination factor NusB [Bacteroidota bacterium]
MLSRRHIRVKVLQTLYVYFNDEDPPTTKALVTLLHRNTDKMYELYLYLLLMVEELGNFMLHYEEEVKGRYILNDVDVQNSSRIYNSTIMQSLMNNEEFHAELKRYKVTWQGDNDLLRKIFLDLKNQEVYNDFLKNIDSKLITDRDVFSFIIKHYPANLALLTQHLEEVYFNWWDDKKIVVQAAIKTIQAISEKQEDFLQPFSQKNHADSIEFAEELLEKTIAQSKELDKLIAPKITKWEPHMIAIMDIIIIKMALCEFINFPSIPLTVTINEYIDLSKLYSTPNSKKFVNGVLDAIRIEMKKDGRLVKN